MSEWQPITTAPVEELVIVSNGQDVWADTKMRQTIYDALDWAEARYYQMSPPTHWMPLPAPPEQTATCKTLQSGSKNPNEIKAGPKSHSLARKA